MATESMPEAAATAAALPGVGSPRPPLSGGLLGRQIVQYAPGVLAPAVMALAFAVVFTRVFDSADYGRYSLAQSAVTLVSLLASQWLQQGINRFLPAAPPGEAVYRLKAAIGLGLLLVCAAVGSAALGVVALGAVLLPPVWFRTTLAAAALVLTTVIFTPLSVVFQAEMRARRSTEFGIATATARLLFALALVFLVGRDPAYLLWAPAGAFALAIPLLWRDGSFPPLARIIDRRSEWWPDVRRMADYGFPVMGWLIAATLLDASDRWIIQLFRGPEEVGIYAANYALVANSVGVVATPMILAVHPFLMRAWGTGDRESAARWLGTVVEWYLIAGTVLVGLVALYSGDLATLLLGPAFRAGHRIIPVVVAGMVAWQLGVYSHKPLEFTERTRLMFGLCAGTTAVNGLLNVLLVPHFGYMAAAYTTLGSYVLYTGVATWAGRRLLRWHLRWSGVLGAVAFAATGFLLAALVRFLVARAFGHGVGMLTSLVVAFATTTWVLARQFLPLLRELRRSARA